MSGPVDVLAVLGSLNLADPDQRPALNEARAAVAELIELVAVIKRRRGECFIPTDDPELPTFNWDERADTALARVKGGAE